MLEQKFNSFCKFWTTLAKAADDKKLAKMKKTLKSNLKWRKQFTSEQLKILSLRLRRRKKQPTIIVDSDPDENWQKVELVECFIAANGDMKLLGQIMATYLLNNPHLVRRAQDAGITLSNCGASKRNLKILLDGDAPSGGWVRPDNTCQYGAVSKNVNGAVSTPFFLRLDRFKILLNEQKGKATAAQQEQIKGLTPPLTTEIALTLSKKARQNGELTPDDSAIFQSALEEGESIKQLPCSYDSLIPDDMIFCKNKWCKVVERYIYEDEPVVQVLNGSMTLGIRINELPTTLLRIQ
jgi:hypothetical protein